MSEEAGLSCGEDLTIYLCDGMTVTVLMLENPVRSARGLAKLTKVVLPPHASSKDKSHLVLARSLSGS